MRRTEEPYLLNLENRHKMKVDKEPSPAAYRTLDRLKKKAEKIVTDHDALRELLGKAQKKLENAEKDDSLMQKLMEYLKLISRMLGNYLNGKYNETPWQTIVMMIAGLLYFSAILISFSIQLLFPKGKICHAILDLGYLFFKSLKPIRP